MFNAIMLMDLHWGAIPPERMEAELREYLYKEIDKLSETKKLDAIFIGGDLFDSKQWLSSDITNYVIRFINTLYELTTLMGTYIFILKGTRTHDDLQLDTLKTILKYRTHIVILDEVTEIEFVHIMDEPSDTDIWVPDLNHKYKQFCEPDEITIKTLLIPEEYIVDQEEYYKDTLYSDKKYDFIIGHGMIDKIWYAKENKSKIVEHSASPVFKVEDLEKSGRHIYFGHIHEHKKYGTGKEKRFQYVGPFTRWEFGKEGSVGYTYIEYFEDTKVCNEYFIENEMAQILTTKVINIQDEITLTELNDKIENIISKEMVNSEKIRFVVNLNSKLNNYLSIRDFLVSRMSELKFVKLVLSIDLDDTKVEEAKAQIDQKNEQLKYIYGSNLELEDKIKVFLKNKRGIDVSAEDIKSVLTMKI